MAPKKKTMWQQAAINGRPVHARTQQALYTLETLPTGASRMAKANPRRDATGLTIVDWSSSVNNMTAALKAYDEHITTHDTPTHLFGVFGGRASMMHPDEIRAQGAAGLKIGNFGTRPQTIVPMVDAYGRMIGRTDLTLDLTLFTDGCCKQSDVVEVERVRQAHPGVRFSSVTAYITTGHEDPATMRDLSVICTFLRGTVGTVYEGTLFDKDGTPYVYSGFEGGEYAVGSTSATARPFFCPAKYNPRTGKLVVTDTRTRCYDDGRFHYEFAKYVEVDDRVPLDFTTMTAGYLVDNAASVSAQMMIYQTDSAVVQRWRTELTAFRLRGLAELERENARIPIECGLTVNGLVGATFQQLVERTRAHDLRYFGETGNGADIFDGLVTMLQTQLDNRSYKIAHFRDPGTLATAERAARQPAEVAMTESLTTFEPDLPTLNIVNKVKVQLHADQVRQVRLDPLTLASMLSPEMLNMLQPGDTYKASEQWAAASGSSRSALTRSTILDKIVFNPTEAGAAHCVQQLARLVFGNSAPGSHALLATIIWQCVRRLPWIPTPTVTAGDLVFSLVMRGQLARTHVRIGCWGSAQFAITQVPIAVAFAYTFANPNGRAALLSATSSELLFDVLDRELSLVIPDAVTTKHRASAALRFFYENPTRLQWYRRQLLAASLQNHYAVGRDVLLLDGLATTPYQITDEDLLALRLPAEHLLAILNVIKPGKKFAELVAPDGPQHQAVLQSFVDDVVPETIEVHGLRVTIPAGAAGLLVKEIFTWARVQQRIPGADDVDSVMLHLLQIQPTMGVLSLPSYTVRVVRQTLAAITRQIGDSYTDFLVANHVPTEVPTEENTLAPAVPGALQQPAVAAPRPMAGILRKAPMHRRVTNVERYTPTPPAEIRTLAAYKRSRNYHGRYGGLAEFDAWFVERIPRMGAKDANRRKVLCEHWAANPVAPTV